MMLQNTKIIAVLIITFVLGSAFGAIARSALQTDVSADTVQPRQDPVVKPTLQAAASAEATGQPQTDDAAIDETLVSITGSAPTAGDQALLARWSALELELRQLRTRVAKLELLAPALTTIDDTEPSAEQLQAEQTLPTQTREDRSYALIASGVEPDVAEALVLRQSDTELKQLDLQDQAIREGWFRSQRYYDEMRTLRQDSVDVRERIGDTAYDRYLYNTGEQNRVAVSSVIGGSVAEEYGLQPGDVIETYDGEPVFDFSELRDATTNGERGDMVEVEVRRGDERIEKWMPRGPIGVQLNATVVDPEAD